MKFKPIGVIHSPYKTLEDIPRQSDKSDDIGEIEIFKEYKDGLKGIEEFEKIIIIFYFHKTESYSLNINRRKDKKFCGVFATRSPRRPNSIGISTVELLEKNGNILKFKGIDMIDGTPILDIKPYRKDKDSL